MGWIKRNLFFVIGGAVALGLLGAGGFYIYQGWDRNSAASAKLQEIYDTLKGLQQQKPSPGNDKIDNAQIAREQHQQLRAWIDDAGKYFQAIPPIPADNATSESFAGELRRTVDALQHEAAGDDVALPPKYDFSFSAQRSLVKFAAGSLGPLAAQLGEVKAVSEIIFSARVNALDSIQRERVSLDDASGPQGDYIDEHSATGDLAVITPYVVTFRCFTPELARVISAFSTAPNTFIIKAINIQPTSANSAAPGDAAAGTLSPSTQPVAGKGGLQTVLKEHLLRVSLEVGLVKLLPRN